MIENTVFQNIIGRNVFKETNQKVEDVDILLYNDIDESSEIATTADDIKIDQLIE